MLRTMKNENVMDMADVNFLALSKRLSKTLNDVKEVIELFEYLDLTDTQVFIEFEDAINKLSVKDHSKQNNANSNLMD